MTRPKTTRKRSGEAQAALGRRAPTMDHRLEPRGGAANESRDLLAEAEDEQLSSIELEDLRALAVLMLEVGKFIDLGIAPEDLVVACDRALGWDDMADETPDERAALTSEAHRQCALAWGML